MSQSSFIEKLFDLFMEDTRTIPEVEQALERIKNTLDPVSDVLDLDMGPIITEYGASCEKQGFINGFRLASKIAAESLANQK